MNICFGLPKTPVSSLIVGASKGVLLSTSLTLAKKMGDVLREKSALWHEGSSSPFALRPFCCQDLTGSPLAVHVADLTHTELSDMEAQELGAALFVLASSLKEKDVFIDFSQHFSPGLLASVAAGFKIRSFTFDKYKTKKDNKQNLENVYFVSSQSELSEKAFEDLDVVAEATFFCRSLSSEVPNVLDPEAMVQEAKKLKKWGVKVDILDEKDMAKLGMNALLGVAQGSVRPPYLAVCQWQGDPKFGAPLALVGKGVTFDSGGISIKPSEGMHEMKEDMTGAAVVLSALQLAAQLKMPLNLVGVIGLVENMPSGSAQRPSDVVVSLSGQTIEVQNTDAEGRLVLADALFYTEREFAPRCIIDFATLTGAIKIALGMEFAGLFSNDDSLSARLLEAGESVKERLWRLPLDPVFDKDINSDIADMKNVGSGRGAGSITAAQFLQRFVQKDTPWAHIDIAYVTHDSKERALTGVGFTGFGVRLMYAFLKSQLVQPMKGKK